MKHLKIHKFPFKNVIVLAIECKMYLKNFTALVAFQNRPCDPSWRKQGWIPPPYRNFEDPYPRNSLSLSPYPCPLPLAPYPLPLAPCPLPLTPYPLPITHYPLPITHVLTRQNFLLADHLANLSLGKILQISIYLPWPSDFFFSRETRAEFGTFERDWPKSICLCPKVMIIITLRPNKKQELGCQFFWGRG